MGTQGEVEGNVPKWRGMSVCQFVFGWFKDSLPQAFNHDQKFVFAVTDVDLFESTRDCLLYIWPRLQPGARLYTDDGGELDIAAIFLNASGGKTSSARIRPG